MLERVTENDAEESEKILFVGLELHKATGVVSHDCIPRLAVAAIATRQDKHLQAIPWSTTRERTGRNASCNLQFRDRCQGLPRFISYHDEDRYRIRSPADTGGVGGVGKCEHDIVARFIPARLAATYPIKSS